MRMLTALIAIFTALAVVATAVPVTAFSLIRIMMPAAAGKGADAVRARLAYWQKVAGVAITARSLQLPATAAARTNREPLRDVKDIRAVLALRPMSSAHWLALAEARIAAMAPAKEINAALTLSYITGPREGYVMIARGMVALEAWDGLSDFLKRKAAQDIALTWPHMGRHQISRTVLALARASAEVRKDIRSALEATPGMQANGLRRLGFTITEKP